MSTMSFALFVVSVSVVSFWEGTNGAAILLGRWPPAYQRASRLASSSLAEELFGRDASSFLDSQLLDVGNSAAAGDEIDEGYANDGKWYPRGKRSAAAAHQRPSAVPLASSSSYDGGFLVKIDGKRGLGGWLSTSLRRSAPPPGFSAPRGKKSEEREAEEAEEAEEEEAIKSLGVVLGGRH